jgi:hypothetical protein
MHTKMQTLSILKCKQEKYHGIYIVLCNIPRNMYEIPKCVKIYRMKFNCSNTNAAIREYYYCLSIYMARNNIYIYIHKNPGGNNEQLKATTMKWSLGS